MDTCGGSHQSFPAVWLFPLASRLSPPASGLWPAPDPSAPKGQKEIAQGRAKRRPGYACATGTLDRSPQANRSAQIWAVFQDAKRDISRISLRTGIEPRAHLESTRKRALRCEKADQAGVRSRYGKHLRLCQERTFARGRHTDVKSVKPSLLPLIHHSAECGLNSRVGWLPRQQY
jgi:hypothetical protein